MFKQSLSVFTRLRSSRTINKKVLTAAFFTTLVLLLSGNVAFASVRPSTPCPQVFLIQNSGWMEPFFTDKNSMLGPVLERFGAVLADQGDLVVASYNQNGQLPDRKSPHLLYSGKYTPTDFINATKRLDLPRRTNGRYTDADFRGALIGAMVELLGEKPGVIWMVTNNKNAPNNDPLVVDNTREYFKLLSKSPLFTQVVAFPLRMPVKGKNFSEKGFVIYGIGYKPAGGERLKELVHTINSSKIFTDPAVTLKPLNEIPISLEPLGVSPAHLTVKWKDNALTIEGLKGVGPHEVLVDARVNSHLYPHVIDKASLKVTWNGVTHQAIDKSSRKIDVAVLPNEINDLQPNSPGSIVRFRLKLPAIKRDGLTQDRVDMAGYLSLDLSDIQYSFSDGFASKMDELFGLNELPSIFFENQGVRVGSAVVGVRLSTELSVLPLLTILSVVAGLLLLGLLLFFLFGKKRKASVPVNGRRIPVTMRPFQKVKRTDIVDGKTVLLSMGITGKVTSKILEE